VLDPSLSPFHAQWLRSRSTRKGWRARARDGRQQPTFQRVVAALMSMLRDQSKLAAPRCTRKREPDSGEDVYPPFAVICAAPRLRRVGVRLYLPKPRE
jgi:hypothetical protein